MSKKTLNHLKEYALLMRLDKPIGILLLLWPTLWALWIAADGIPPTKILLVFLIGSVLMRSAGCIINDLADRHIDPHVARTHQRPIAAGRVTKQEAIGLFTVLLFAAANCLWFLNLACFKLACLAASITIIYPFCKRVSYWPQAILGIAFSISIPMAFAALNRPLTLITACLFFAACLWTIAYDTQYAMVDRACDLKINVRSTAVLWGQYDRVFIGLLQVLMLTLLVCVGRLQHFHWPFYLSLCAVIGSFTYQQTLTYSQDPKQCFRAFLNNNWVGLAIFIGVVLG